MNLNNVMLGSEDPRALGAFYGKILGAPDPDWSDEANGWFAFKAGDGSLAVGPHSEVKGRSPEPARIMMNFAVGDVKAEFERIRALGVEVVAEPYDAGGGMYMCTFADPDGNYFQLAPPWDPPEAG